MSAAVSSGPSVRSNNLDALRLAGAAAVIVGHAYHLTGRPEQVPSVLGYPLQALGVVIFFSISGYLITASWSRSPNVVTYGTARVLRIFPALIAVVLITTFVLGPVVSTLTVGQYFDDPRSLRYLINIAMQPQYDLPGVFTTLPYPAAVNGSLWTLPAELFCYLMVPLLCLVPRRLRPITFGFALVASLALAAVPAVDSPVIWGTRISDAAIMWVFFAAGALLRLAHERFRGIFRVDVGVGLVLAYLLALAVEPTWVVWISWIALPYGVLAIGLANTPFVRRAARWGDLSYGIYLLGFPLQQLVVQQIGVLPMLPNLVLVFGLSAALAWVSWHAVEAPSLRLKDSIAARSGRRSTAPEVPRDGDPSPNPIAPAAGTRVSHRA